MSWRVTCVASTSRLPSVHKARSRQLHSLFDFSKTIHNHYNTPVPPSPAPPPASSPVWATNGTPTISPASTHGAATALSSASEPTPAPITPVASVSPEKPKSITFRPPSPTSSTSRSPLKSHIIPASTILFQGKASAKPILASNENWERPFLIPNPTSLPPLPHIYNADLTQAAFGVRDKEPHFQRLALIGDGLLFHYALAGPERTGLWTSSSHITEIRSKLVMNSTFAHLTIIYGLNLYKTNDISSLPPKSSQHFAGSLFEAYIAAAYLDARQRSPEALVDFETFMYELFDYTKWEVSRGFKVKNNGPWDEGFSFTRKYTLDRPVEEELPQEEPVTPPKKKPRFSLVRYMLQGIVARSRHEVVKPVDPVKPSEVEPWLFAQYAIYPPPSYRIHPTADAFASVKASIAPIKAATTPGLGMARTTPLTLMSTSPPPVPRQVQSPRAPLPRPPISPSPRSPMTRHARPSIHRFRKPIVTHRAKRLPIVAKQPWYLPSTPTQFVTLPLRPSAVVPPMNPSPATPSYTFRSMTPSNQSKGIQAAMIRLNMLTNPYRRNSKRSGRALLVMSLKEKKLIANLTEDIALRKRMLQKGAWGLFFDSAGYVIEEPEGAKDHTDVAKVDSADILQGPASTSSSLDIPSEATDETWFTPPTPDESAGLSKKAEALDWSSMDFDLLIQNPDEANTSKTTGDVAHGASEDGVSDGDPAANSQVGVDSYEYSGAQEVESGNALPVSNMIESETSDSSSEIHPLLTKDGSPVESGNERSEVDRHIPSVSVEALDRMFPSSVHQHPIYSLPALRDFPRRSLSWVSALRRLVQYLDREDILVMSNAELHAMLARQYPRMPPGQLLRLRQRLTTFVFWKKGQAETTGVERAGGAEGAEREEREEDLSHFPNSWRISFKFMRNLLKREDLEKMDQEALLGQMAEEYPKTNPRYYRGLSIRLFGYFEWKRQQAGLFKGGEDALGDTDVAPLNGNLPLDPEHDKPSFSPIPRRSYLASTTEEEAMLARLQSEGLPDPSSRCVQALARAQSQGLLDREDVFAMSEEEMLVLLMDCFPSENEESCKSIREYLFAYLRWRESANAEEEVAGMTNGENVADSGNVEVRTRIRRSVRARKSQSRCVRATLPRLASRLNRVKRLNVVEPAPGPIESLPKPREEPDFSNPSNPMRIALGQMRRLLLREDLGGMSRQQLVEVIARDRPGAKRGTLRFMSRSLFRYFENRRQQAGLSQAVEDEVEDRDMRATEEVNVETEGTGRRRTKRSSRRIRLFRPRPASRRNRSKRTPGLTAVSDLTDSSPQLWQDSSHFPNSQRIELRRVKRFLRRKDVAEMSVERIYQALTAEHPGWKRAAVRCSATRVFRYFEWKRRQAALLREGPKESGERGLGGLVDVSRDGPGSNGSPIVIHDGSNEGDLRGLMEQAPKTSSDRQMMEQQVATYLPGDLTQLPTDLLRAAYHQQMFCQNDNLLALDKTGMKRRLQSLFPKWSDKSIRNTARLWWRVSEWKKVHMSMGALHVGRDETSSKSVKGDLGDMLCAASLMENSSPEELGDQSEDVSVEVPAKEPGSDGSSATIAGASTAEAKSTFASGISYSSREQMELEVATYLPGDLAGMSSSLLQSAYYDRAHLQDDGLLLLGPRELAERVREHTPRGSSRNVNAKIRRWKRILEWKKFHSNSEAGEENTKRADHEVILGEFGDMGRAETSLVHDLSGGESDLDDALEGGEGSLDYEVMPPDYIPDDPPHTKDDTAESPSDRGADLRIPSRTSSWHERMRSAGSVNRLPIPMTAYGAIDGAQPARSDATSHISARSPSGYEVVYPAGYPRVPAIVKMDASEPGEGHSVSEDDSSLGAIESSGDDGDVTDTSLNLHPPKSGDSPPRVPGDILNMTSRAFAIALNGEEVSERQIIKARRMQQSLAALRLLKAIKGTASLGVVRKRHLAHVDFAEVEGDLMRPVITMNELLRAMCKYRSTSNELEFMSLSMGQRKELARAWADEFKYADMRFSRPVEAVGDAQRLVETVGDDGRPMETVWAE